MAYYNDTWMNNVTNIVDIMEGIGTSMGNQFLLGYMLLIGFGLIFLISALRYDLNTVLIADGFIVTILAVLLTFVGLVPAAAIVYPFIVLLLSLVIYMFSGK